MNNAKWLKRLQDGSPLRRVDSLDNCCPEVYDHGPKLLKFIFASLIWRIYTFEVMETVAAYIDALPADRKAVVERIRTTIKKALPKGFKEIICYNMIGYVVPHSLYPAGYHCKPEQALPFLNLASQKNFIALYHMGMYADNNLLNWFVSEYPKHSKAKLDMGKSCIRFKKMDDIPYTLIGELAGKLTPQQWIDLYEKNLQKK